MSLNKPQTLIYNQTVLQYKGKYYAIVSSMMGFYLKEPDKLIHEKNLNLILGQLQSKTDIEKQYTLNEGYAKQKAEVMVVGTEYGPIVATDPKRWDYFKADKSYWQKQGLPTLPDQFDFRFFQQAPLAQQREGYFEPQEAYAFKLGKETFTGVLPNFKVRLLLADRKLASVEYPMRADTFYILPEEHKGILIHRACFEVSDIHMNEWMHILLALEEPDQPKTLQELQELLPQKPKPSLAGVKADTERDRGYERDLRDTKKSSLIDYDFKDVDLTGETLSGKTFINCYFENSCFYQAKLHKLTFLNCQFTGGEWRGAVIDNCKFVETICEEINAGISLWSETQIVGGQWRKLNLTDATFHALRGQSFKMIDSNLQKTTATHLMLSGKETALIRVDCSEAKWESPNLMESWWYKVKVDHADMSGAECSATKIIRCQLNNSFLNNSRFGDALFLKSNFHKVSFAKGLLEGAFIKKSAFVNCDMKGVDQRHLIIA